MTDTNISRRALKDEVDGVGWPNFIDAMRAVVDYLEPDERKDWESREPSERKNHIYESVWSLKVVLLRYDVFRTERGAAAIDALFTALSIGKPIG